MPADGCLRCGAALDGKAFCAACGQRRAQRLELGRVVADMLGQFAQLDTVFLRTLVGMSRSPGRVARAYVRGDRAIGLARRAK